MSGGRAPNNYDNTKLSLQFQAKPIKPNIIEQMTKSIILIIYFHRLIRHPDPAVAGEGSVLKPRFFTRRGGVRMTHRLLIDRKSVV